MTNITNNITTVVKVFVSGKGTCNNCLFNEVFNYIF